MYKAIDIARYVINYDYVVCKSIPAMNVSKLQSVLYFIQAYYQAKYHKCCFDDVIYARSCGVHIDSVYSEYKQFGMMAIPTIKYYYQYDETNIWNTKKFKFDDSIIAIEDKEVINDIVQYFSKDGCLTLVDIITHQLCWRDGYYRDQQKIISAESLHQYFKE